MPNNLSEADEAEHRITFREGREQVKKVRAAYVTTEDKHPDMLAFKDHENRTVLLVSRELVLSVERTGQQGECAESTLREHPGLSGTAYWSGPAVDGMTLKAVRCPGCLERIPVDCPARMLMEAASLEQAFEQAIAGATAQARRECPDHDVIRLGR
jgi:hypothetical protein